MNKYAQFSHAEENRRKILQRMSHKQCAQKNAYASKAEALGAAQIYDEKYGSKSRAYQCRYCKKWHLTTRKKLQQ